MSKNISSQSHIRLPCQSWPLRDYFCFIFQDWKEDTEEKVFLPYISLSSHVYGLNGLAFFPTCYKIHSSFFLIRIEGERGRKRENIIWHRVWHYFSDNIESTYYNREFSLAYTNIYPLFLFHLCTRHDILFKNESFI